MSSIKQLRETGSAPGDAVIAGARRLRRQFWFHSDGASTSTGAEVQRPLANVVIWGPGQLDDANVVSVVVLYSWFVGERAASE